MPEAELLCSRGFRYVYGDGSLSEWELRTTQEIGWRLLLIEKDAMLAAHLIDQRGHLLPCGGVNCERQDIETKLLPLLQEIDSLPVLRRIWWRSGTPCQEVRQRFLDWPTPPWSLEVPVPERWLSLETKPDQFDEQLRQLADPLLQGAGFLHTGEYWIREASPSKATIIEGRRGCLFATDWRQRDDLTWHNSETGTIASMEGEPEEVAQWIREWLEQR